MKKKRIYHIKRLPSVMNECVGGSSYSGSHGPPWIRMLFDPIRYNAKCHCCGQTVEDRRLDRVITIWNSGNTGG